MEPRRPFHPIEPNEAEEVGEPVAERDDPDDAELTPLEELKPTVAELELTSLVTLDETEALLSEPADAPIPINERRLKPRLTVQQRTRRLERIVNLRADGLANKAIARRLRLAPTTVDKLTSKLGQTGRIQRRRGQRARGPRIPEGVRRTRAATIRAMCAEGKTLAEIGEELNLSGERVRQLKREFGIG